VISIVIPAYNQERTIKEAIKSCLSQDYPDKEILLVDDASTDKTVAITHKLGVKVIINETNVGIGCNLSRCQKEAKGKYIVYLCGDDYFTHQSVVGDIVSIFKMFPNVGVIDRNYYQFINGYKGAISVVREKNILVSSVNPSGMAFRREAMIGEFSNEMFIEMPSMVKEVIKRWESYKMPYDTVAVRLHAGNTCISKSYYKTSPTESFAKVVPTYVSYGVLITLKNRAPHLLLRELNVISRIKPNCIFSPKFWIYALIALLIPGCILRRLTNFYKHRIGRRFCEIKSRMW